MGASVAVLEPAAPGGECPNTACVPTKALLRSAQAVEEIRQARGLGVHAGQPEIRWPEIRARVRAITGADEGLEPVFRRWRAEGMAVYAEQGVLLAPDLVKAGSARLKARRVVVATGSVDVYPPVPGIEGRRVITHKEAIDLPALPARLVIIGAGPVGVEFAQIFAPLGVSVTLISADQLPLPREDEELSRRLLTFLQESGIDYHGGIRVLSVEEKGEEVAVCWEEEGLARYCRADLVLSATGHRPYTDDAGLAELGLVEKESGRIKVDGKLCTTAEGVYAAGDVTGVAAFTHIASYQGRLAVLHALGADAPETEYRVVPRVTFCRPELAAVGMTEGECRQRRLDYLTATAPLSSIEKTVLEAAPEGLAKLLVAPGSGQILGAHVLSPRAGELIHQPALAMQARIPAKEMGRMIHAFPTFSEIWETTAARLKDP